MNNQEILEKVKKAHPKAVQKHEEMFDQLHLWVSKEHLLELMPFLRDDPLLDFALLSDVTSVDYMPKTPRFDVIYILFSLTNQNRVIIHVLVEEDEEIPSVSVIWASANWGEREVYDLMGIRFSNHPDLRRILTWDNFEGHALRKDFPCEGYDIEGESLPYTIQVNSAFSDSDREGKTI